MLMMSSMSLVRDERGRRHFFLDNLKILTKCSLTKALKLQRHLLLLTGNQFK